MYTYVIYLFRYEYIQERKEFQLSQIWLLSKKSNSRDNADHAAGVTGRREELREERGHLQRFFRI